MMAGIGAGDGPLVHGVARTGAGDTGLGGGACRVYLLRVTLSPLDEVQLEEVWAPSEKVQDNRVGKQQEVRGTVPWKQEMLGE